MKAVIMACDADFLAPKPTNLSMAQAAALPLVCLTAWEHPEVPGRRQTEAR